MGGEILTLEPLIDAIRLGVENAGWELSGLQKTTSHQFEGKWEGESTRSAYLFFHLPTGPETVGVDVYLDETSRGLSGNLALVVDLAAFARLGDTNELLTSFGQASRDHLSDRYRRPITLRFRVPDAASDPGGAEAEVRFKVRISSRVVTAGSVAIRTLAEETMLAFHQILGHGALEGRTPEPDRHAPGADDHVP